MQIKGGKFLVTGGASMIGAQLAEQLLAAGSPTTPSAPTNPPLALVDRTTSGLFCVKRARGPVASRITHG